MALIEQGNGLYKLTKDADLNELVYAFNENVDKTIYLYWCDPYIVDDFRGGEEGVGILLSERLFFLGNEIHIKASVATGETFLPVGDYLHQLSPLLERPTITEYTLALETTDTFTVNEALTILKFNTQSLIEDASTGKRLQKWAVELSELITYMANKASPKLDELITLRASVRTERDFCKGNQSDFHLHVHRAGHITTGVFEPARLGTGTPSNTKYLNGNGQWVNVT